MKTNTSGEDMIYDITRQDRGGLGMTGQKNIYRTEKKTSWQDMLERWHDISGQVRKCFDLQRKKAAGLVITWNA